MTGIRWPPEESDVVQPSRGPAATDLVSDDDRSVAADSWSIKSEYGSTLDDEQRQVDAAELLSGCNFRASSDYRLNNIFLSLSFRNNYVRLLTLWISDVGVVRMSILLICSFTRRS